MTLNALWYHSQACFRMALDRLHGTYRFLNPVTEQRTEMVISLTLTTCNLLANFHTSQDISSHTLCTKLLLHLSLDTPFTSFPPFFQTGFRSLYVRPHEQLMQAYTDANVLFSQRLALNGV